mgnify:CR=1 FL=1
MKGRKILIKIVIKKSKMCLKIKIEILVDNVNAKFWPRIEIFYLESQF